VGDQGVDGVRAADPGEGALAELGQGGYNDGALAAAHQLGVDAGLVREHRGTLTCTGRARTVVNPRHVTGG
jgi:hypothetical protein